MPDTMTLTVNGQNFTDWTEFTISRAIDKLATDVNIAVTERAVGQIPWALLPFAQCTLTLNGKLVLTGYLDTYLPSGDAKSHSVRIVGRSKTEDIVDSSADIKGGQFSGYTLDRIVRAVCQPFGIAVIVAAEMGDAFDDVQLYRHETAFTFLERLCRLRGVLASDDEHGNLVLTTAGSSRASGALQEGPTGTASSPANIWRYHATLSGAKRFSVYKVIGQHQVDDDTEGAAATEIEAQATDQGVPRYRPHVMVGETQLTPAMARLRANWQARYNRARGTEATITVKGWQQPDGSLWTVNQVVPVHAKTYLKLDQDLLLVRVAYKMTGQDGATTELTLGPQDGWTPDPGEVKVRKGGKGTSQVWNDVKPISSAITNASPLGVSPGGGVT